MNNTNSANSVSNIFKKIQVREQISPTNFLREQRVTKESRKREMNWQLREGMHIKKCRPKEKKA